MSKPGFRIRFVLFTLCLLALGATEKLCPVHNAPMKKKLVPIIFLMDRYNLEEWQAYTNARAQLFPYSDDKLYRDVFQIHVSRFRSSRLAVSQSMNCSAPEATRSALSLRIGPCQAGDSMRSASRQRSAHRASIAQSFSSQVICSMGKVFITNEI